MTSVVKPETIVKSSTTGRREVDYSLAMIDRARKRLMYQHRVVEKLRTVGAPRSLAVAIDILAAMEAELASLISRHDCLLTEAGSGQRTPPEHSAQISFEDRMPRYFFHRINGGVSTDTEGTIYHNVQQARIEAIAYAAETAKDSPDFVWASETMKINVSDESGVLLFTVAISIEDHPES